MQLIWSLEFTLISTFHFHSKPRGVTTNGCLKWGDDWNILAYNTCPGSNSRLQCKALHRTEAPEQDTRIYLNHAALFLKWKRVSRQRRSHFGIQVVLLGFLKCLVCGWTWQEWRTDYLHHQNYRSGDFCTRKKRKHSWNEFRNGTVVMTAINITYFHLFQRLSYYICKYCYPYGSHTVFW